MSSLTNNEKFWFEPLIWFLVLLFALITFLSFYGCSSVKKTSKTETVISKVDTVFLEKREIIKDTVVRIEADSTLFEALIECDSNNQAYISKINNLSSGVKTSVKYVFKDKILTVESKVNKDSIVIYWRNFYEREYQKKVSETSTDSQTETIKKTGQFYKMVFWIAVVIIVILLAWKLLPKFFPALKVFL